ncbi:MAG: DUF2202 domain-containing protein [Saprospiraceae bacterium]|nr:DUF2202 domain-containing protein [Saprospiraceae bacterium]
MKNFKLLLAMLSLLFVSAFFIQSTEPDTDGEEVSACEVVNYLPHQELNATEKEALLMMIEEEKLARDVYITLGKEYDVKVFKNISDAENRHMEAIECLFEKYDLKNPIEEKALGEFSSRKFQDMYESLVIRGRTDITEALKIGASIEDLDIYDLNELLESRTTDNDDLKAVFKELAKGSRNHMRAFTKNLKKQNATYEVKHITKDQYESIIAHEQERGGWLCGDEKPRDGREKGCKGEKGKCGDGCKGNKNGKQKCKGEGHHGKH